MVNNKKLVLKKRIVCEYGGYGKNDPREGSHLKKKKHNKYISTLTCLSHFNKVILECYEDVNP